MIKESRGITLVVLVVTIIILLILSGITIMELTGENGLIMRAKEAKQKETESAIKETVQLMLSEYQIEKTNNEEINLTEYLNEQKDKGILDDVTDNKDGIIYVMIKGYTVKINESELEIIEISNLEMNLIGTYEIKSYNGNTLKILIKITNKNGEIDKIQCPDGNILQCNGKDIVGIDYEVIDGEIYNFIVSSNGANNVCKIQTKGMTKNNSVEMRDLADFKEFQTLVNAGYNFENKCINLKNDLDLSSICYKVDGTVTNDVSWTPIGNEVNQFNGTFDGEGHKINNLYINSNEDYKALFGKALNATIKNIILNNEEITGKQYVAGILGYGENVTIENCGLQGNIKGTLNDCGGIAGKVSNGTISHCYNQADITLDAAATRIDWAGGIIGYIDNAEVSYCYNTGDIVVKAYPNQAAPQGARSGGIVGYASNNSALEYSYNIGNITSYGYGVEPGGISGCLYISNINSCFNIGSINGIQSGWNRTGNITAWTMNSSVNNCYYIANNMCGFNYSGNSFSNNKLETANNIKNIAISILGGDNNIWMQSESTNDGYPILKWQVE